MYSDMLDLPGVSLRTVLMLVDRMGFRSKTPKDNLIKGLFTEFTWGRSTGYCVLNFFHPCGRYGRFFRL